MAFGGASSGSLESTGSFSNMSTAARSGRPARKRVCQRARCDQLGAAGIYGRFHARQIVADYASAGEVNESQVQRDYVACGERIRLCSRRRQILPYLPHSGSSDAHEPAPASQSAAKSRYKLADAAEAPDPRVFAATDSPKQASGHSGNDGTLRCHWPAYKFTVYDGKRRNAASTNSQVNSAVACE
jgi:hypothetical protein